jgi:hypothetical protein
MFAFKTDFPETTESALTQLPLFIYKKEPITPPPFAYIFSLTTISKTQQHFCSVVLFTT